MQIAIQIMQTEPLSKKGYPVKLIISHKGKIKRKLLFHSFPQNWDFGSNVPLNTHPNFNKVMPDIFILKAKIYEAEKMGDLTAAINFLTDTEKAKKNTSITIGKFIDQLVSEMKMQNRDGHGENFSTAKNEFLRFTDDLSFEDLDYNLLVTYKSFLMSKNRNAGKFGTDGKPLPFQGISKSTVHNHLKMLRIAYYDYCRRYNVEKRPIFEGIFNGITVKFNRNKKKYITIDDLIKLENSTLENRMGRAVDLWLLTFYLGGVNLKDLYYLKNKNISNGRAYFKRAKKGDDGYEFDVKIFDKAAKILNKYRSPDDEYVFNFDKSFIRFKQFYNDHWRAMPLVQKRLGIEVQPTGGKLSFNVARHTFSTIGVQKGVNREIKGLLMGHDIGDIQSVYEDYPEEMRDAAHWEIIRLDS